MLGNRAVEIIKQRKIASIQSPQQDINNPQPTKANGQVAQALVPMMSQGAATRTGGDQTNNKERYSGNPI
jgi:hypothetical protein